MRYIERSSRGGLLCRDCVLLGGLKNNEYVTIHDAARDARAVVEASLAMAEARVRELRKGQHDVAAVIPGRRRKTVGMGAHGASSCFYACCMSGHTNICLVADARMRRAAAEVHEEFGRIIGAVESKAEAMGASVKDRRDVWAKDAAAERENVVTALVAR